MPNFNEGTPLDPQTPSLDELSPVDREVLEFFEMLEMKYALHGTDLPWSVMGGLVRQLNRKLHPVDSANFCEKAGALLKDMAADMAEIANDAKKCCH